MMNEQKTRQSDPGAAGVGTATVSAAQLAAAAAADTTVGVTSAQDLLQLLAKMLTERHLPTLGREALEAVERYRAIRGALAHDQREDNNVSISR